MSRTATLVAAVMMALLAIPVPTVTADESEPYIPPNNPDAFEWPANQIVVDAVSGIVIDRVDIGANLTHVRITNVQADGTFTLKDPNGYLVFENQRSRSDGVLEFWYIDFIVGLWTVTQNVNGIETTILSFVPPMGAMPLSGGSARTQYGYNSGRTETCNAPPTYSLVASQDFWTPLVIVHSPHGGSASATTQATKARAKMIGPWGWGSEEAASSNIGASDGESKADARLARWGKYARYDYTNCQTRYMGYTMKVIDWAPGGTVRYDTLDFTGSSRATGGDDRTSACAQSWCSITVDHRYRGADAIRSTSSGPINPCTTSSTFYQFGGGVSFSHGWVGFDAVSYFRSSGSSLQYCYNFPGGSTWRVDWQPGETNAWAFCRPSHASCA